MEDETLVGSDVENLAVILPATESGYQELLLSIRRRVIHG